MNFKELLTAAREELMDTEGTKDSDFALTTSMALRYLNEAISEACRRSRLLIDADTAAICTIAVTAGQSVYPRDERIVKILSAELAGQVVPLEKMFKSDMPLGWKEHTGKIRGWVNDYATNKIRFYRIPEENGTVTLTVQRTPLNSLTASGTAATPEIPSRYHFGLINYVVAKVRNIQDRELYDPVKAAAFMKLFDDEFGPKRSAHSEAYEASQPMNEDE